MSSSAYIAVSVVVLAQGVQLRNGNAKEGIEHVDRQVCSRASYRVLHGTCHASRRLHGLSGKVAARLCAAGGSCWRMLHALYGMLYVAYLGPPVMFYFDATRCISLATPDVVSACLCACARRSTIAVWRCDSASCCIVHTTCHVAAIGCMAGVMLPVIRRVCVSWCRCAAIDTNDAAWQRASGQLVSAGLFRWFI